MRDASILIGAMLLATIAAPTGAAHAADRPQAPQTRSLYLQLIHQARADGRPRAALSYLDDFDRQFPNDVNAHVLRVNSLLDLGQIDEAERAVALLAKTSGNPDLDAVRGHVLAARGKWRESLPFYRAAVAGSPADPLMHNALGYALLRSGDGPGAIEQLRGAIDLAPADQVIRNNLLLAFVMSGRKADLTGMMAQVGDRRAQADLLRTISIEAMRLAALPAAKKGA